MSSPEERSPKRQRLESYSPASPKLEPKSFVQPPQTPPPSVHMSPSWQVQQLPGLGMHASVTGAGVTIPTPPSTSGFQSQTVGRSTTSEDGGGESEQQTPAQDMETQITEPRVEEADAEMTEPQSRQDGAQGDVLTSGDGEHRWTDHEREANENRDVVAPLPGTSQLYKLSLAPVLRTQPHPSQDMFSLYNLTRLQSSVARKDPITGAKINRLRKSYEGKLKDLGLEGKNKAKPDPGKLEGLVDPLWNEVYPDGKTMWQNQRFAELEFSQAGAEEKLYGLLNQALQMRAGQMPKTEHEHWKGVLGLDELGFAPPAIATAAPPLPRQNFSFASTPASATKPVAPPSLPAKISGPLHPPTTTSPNFANNVTARPDRAGKKRRYDESSYEGYDDDDDGYSSGAAGDGSGEMGRRRSSGKRQKLKEFATASSSTVPSTATSPTFAPSSAGVGIRSS